MDIGSTQQVVNLVDIDETPAPVEQTVETVVPATEPVAVEVESDELVTVK